MKEKTEKAWVHELSALLGVEYLSTQAVELSNYGYDQWPLAAKWKRQGKLPYSPDAIVRPTTIEKDS